MNGHRVLAPALMLALVLTGCGDGDPGDRKASPLVGPPEWWAAREGKSNDGQTIQVRATEPCEVSISVEGLPGGSQALPFRTLAAGDSVRIWWETQARPEGADAVPGPADAESGRTEGHFGGFLFGYDDSATLSSGATYWARPGHGRRAVADTLPPPKPEALAFGAEAELAAVALAAVESGAIELRPSSTGHRLQGSLEEAAAPAVVLRLLLRVRRVGGASTDR